MNHIDNTSRTLCREYEIKARESKGGSGWIGEFAIPGKDLQFARDDDNQISVFDTEVEAIAAAGEDLCEVLNLQGSGHFTTFGYRQMGAVELQNRLSDIGIDVATFATLCGVDLRRMTEWMTSQKPIPRTIYLISHLLGTPGMIDEARAFVREITYRKGGR